MKVIRVLWPYGDGVCWDQSLMNELLTGLLWPLDHELGLRFRPEGDERATEEGGIVVVHGCVAADGTREDFGLVEKMIAGMPWAIVLHTSDEQLTWNSGTIRSEKVKTWISMPSQRGTVAHDRATLLGWREETRGILRDIPRLSANFRQRLWSFAGQIQNENRSQMVVAVEGRLDGSLLATGGFGQGRDLVDHLGVMRSSKIILCPSGNTVDCQRPYEALESGCLPIADRRGPSWAEGDGGYWQHVLGFEPFPCIDSWSEAPALLDRYRDDPVALQRDTNRATAWWVGYKRKLAANLSDDIQTLSGEAAETHPVTVLMPTSYIGSHPSTEIIEEALAKMRAYPEMRDAEVIVMIDGLHPDHAEHAADYEEYKRRLIDLCSWDPGWFGVMPLVFDQHTHQAGMMRRALEMVRTPLVFFQEHDTWPVWDIDWEGLFRAMAEPTVNEIQFHTFDTVIPDHLYLMLDEEPRDVAGVQLRRHCKFSARPLLARTDWLREMIAEHFSESARTFVEDVLWGVISTQVKISRRNWDRYGLWLYCPDDPVHGILRSMTSDGRKDAPKVPLVFAYDGAAPCGAPPAGEAG